MSQIMFNHNLHSILYNKDTDGENERVFAKIPERLIHKNCSSKIAEFHLRNQMKWNFGYNLYGVELQSGYWFLVLASKLMPTKNVKSC